MAKLDELKLLLSEMQNQGIELDLILLCEPFLHDGNTHLFGLPGYNFIALHVHKGLLHNLIYAMILQIFEEGKFEFIFIVTVNSDSAISLGEYDTIQSKLFNIQNIS